MTTSTDAVAVTKAGEKALLIEVLIAIMEGDYAEAREMGGSRVHLRDMLLSTGVQQRVERLQHAIRTAVQLKEAEGAEEAAAASAAAEAEAAQGMLGGNVIPFRR